MAKVTWLGEDVGDTPGPSFTNCYGMKFPKGVAVEVLDKDTMTRARKNQFFEVSGVVGRPAKGLDTKETVIDVATEQANEQDAR